MTWKELKDKISLMTEEEQRQEVAVWGENMNLMKDCSLEKTDEDMYYNSEWDYTREESELEPFIYYISCGYNCSFHINSKLNRHGTRICYSSF